MNVNCEQQHTSADFYTNSIQDGNIASNSMTVANIGNDSAMGQALFMVGNAAFEHGTLRALRSLSITCVILLAQHFLITVIGMCMAVPHQQIVVIPITDWKEILAQICTIYF